VHDVGRSLVDRKDHDAGRGPKIRRKSTIAGAIATPLLMSNAEAMTNSGTSARS
jgi:hypothetical protein